MKEHLAALAEQYSALNAPTGYEQPVIRRLRDHLRPLSDEFQIGVNGNVYARKQGKRPGLTLMIAPTWTKWAASSATSTPAA